ncbi:hypothetical protein IMSAGC019_01517 [Lachnospiraceae bacterium]|nr:hypothetical protein IMSAGC019_01517 [Lachnospiraceae bacterium]
MKKNRDLTAITAASIEKYLLFNSFSVLEDNNV